MAIAAGVAGMLGFLVFGPLIKQATAGTLHRTHHHSLGKASLVLGTARSLPRPLRQAGSHSGHHRPTTAKMSAAVAEPPAEVATAVAVPPAEVAKLFGRFAEKVLYLDKEVGACCHSACSDCEWRLPDGGYRFDYIKAARPKWVPCYLSRDHKLGSGGCHVPGWAAALFPDGTDTPITRADFEARIRDIAYSAAMGPKGTIRSGEDTPSAEAFDLFWAWLSGGIDARPAEELEPMAVLKRLQDMSLDENREGAIGEGPDSVDWKGFAKALGISPLDRW